MKIFSFLKKGDVKPTRDEVLEQNENQVFEIDIKDDMRDSGQILAYTFDSVFCDIIGDLDCLKSGAVLYIRKEGILVNANKEQVLAIQNHKIIDMVNDFFDKDKFSSLRARYISADETTGIVNIGFYKNINSGEEEDFED